MSRGVSTGTRCPRCRKSFGGAFVFSWHQKADGTCLKAPELRARGLRRNAAGAWVRPRVRQLTIFDARETSLVRRMFGVPYSALSAPQRREYRSTLARASDSSSVNPDEPRNALQGAGSTPRAAA